MIVVYAVIVIVWLLIRSKDEGKSEILFIVGLITCYIIAVMASLSPITEFQLDESVELRTFSPAAYPFCIQQLRNYTAYTIRYSLYFGWPEGILLFESATWDNQSEFIHFLHYSFGLMLGLILLFSTFLLVGFLTLIDKKGVFVRDKPIITALPILIILQLSLILLLISPLLFGNVIYGIGGGIVLVISVYPTFQEIRALKRMKTH